MFINIINKETKINLFFLISHKYKNLKIQNHKNKKDI